MTVANFKYSSNHELNHKEFTMLGVNAKQLGKMLEAQKQISQQANRLSNQLIRELEVQNGFGLANFLDVDSNFDNFTAIRAWVQRQMNHSFGNNSLDFEALKHQLFELVPEGA